MNLTGRMVLDTYVVEQELGAGAMGTVWLGHHVKLKRKVAIKVMHDHLTGELVLLERFRREGLLASKLNHVNVVGVLDVGEMPDGKPVIVMEYARGTSLGEVMNEGPMRVVRMIPLLEQILRGLDHAHAMGLIHRDLKPDNVILTGDHGDEIARIVDFGVAVLRAPDESIEGGRLTASGMIVGTPQYMAPEQAKAEHTDHRADLYALGIIMYEMIAGITPFVGTAMEVALAKIDHDPPPFAKRAPQVVIDPVLEAYMRKLLARDPSARFATAHAALEVLEIYGRDRLAAAGKLGIIDVARALDVVSLPPPPRR